MPVCVVSGTKQTCAPQLPPSSVSATAHVVLVVEITLIKAAGFLNNISKCGVEALVLFYDEQSVVLVICWFQRKSFLPQCVFEVQVWFNSYCTYLDVI